MKEPLLKNQKSMVTGGIAAALIVIFIIFAYMPKHNSVKELKSHINEMERQIEVTQIMLGDLGRLGHVLGEMQQELASFEKRLPDKKQTSSILSELSNLAKTSSIEVVSIKPDEPIPVFDENHNPVTLDKKPFKSMKVELNLQAHYKPLAEYVRKIQDSLNILATIDEIDITQQNKIASKLSINLLLTVYIVD